LLRVKPNPYPTVHDRVFGAVRGVRVYITVTVTVQGWAKPSIVCVSQRSAKTCLIRSSCCGGRRPQATMCTGVGGERPRPSMRGYLRSQKTIRHQQSRTPKAAHPGSQPNPGSASASHLRPRPSLQPRYSFRPRRRQHSTASRRIHRRYILAAGGYPRAGGCW